VRQGRGSRQREEKTHAKTDRILEQGVVVIAAGCVATGSSKQGPFRQGASAGQRGPFNPLATRRPNARLGLARKTSICLSFIPITNKPMRIQDQDCFVRLFYARYGTYFHDDDC